ncbi:uncharacterized protein [Nicotiana tomentosiformis]|uniref:uncharacterized protein n=1 Tax=Nicotiana tomentosiformis TaxID=4098 RepID=UPI00388C58A5
MWAQEREEKEAKRPQDFGTYSGARAPVSARHGRGNVSHPVHLALLASSGSTYSYVTSYFAIYLGVYHDYLSSLVYVSTPMGDSLIVDCVYRSCLIVLSGFETIADLLLLSMVDIDVILDMEWMSPYHAIFDYHVKTMMLSILGLPRLKWRGTLDYVPSRVIKFLKVKRMVEKGCDTYLAYVRNISVDTPTVESVLVVRDYPDIFLVDLSGMPPVRDINFGIDLLPGTQPISIPPYRMDPPDLKDLKEKLHKLLDKGFI